MGILVVGTLAKPRKPTAEAAPPPSQIETQRLQRLSQRQALDTMTEHLSSVAAEVAARVVPVTNGVGTGLVWGQDLVVVPSRLGPAPETAEITLPSGDRLVGTHYVSGPELPLAAYRAPGLPPAPASRLAATAQPRSGEWVLAVWRRELEHAFVPGHYLETQLARCGEQTVEEVSTSLALTDKQVGGGLFDLDDALVGIILPCGERVTAISPGSVARLMAEGSTFDGRMLARLGMRVIAMDEALQAHFNAGGGVLVQEVWDAYPAASSGLRPGDVLQTLGGRPVTSRLDLQPLLVPPGDEGWLLGVRRGRRQMEARVAPRSAFGLVLADEATGVILERPRPGYRIATVVPGSRGDEAGLRPGDRILRIDGAAPRSPAAVQRALEGRDAVFLELQRGKRRLGLLLS